MRKQLFKNCISKNKKSIFSACIVICCGFYAPQTTAQENSTIPVDLGPRNEFFGQNGIAIGILNWLYGKQNAAFGMNNDINGDWSAAFGYYNKVNYRDHDELGRAYKNKSHLLAVGNRNEIDGNYSYAFGFRNKINFLQKTIALGNNNIAGQATWLPFSGNTAIIGNDNEANSFNSVVIGGKNKISGSKVNVIGYNNGYGTNPANNISQNGSNILGSDNTVVVRNARVLGDKNKIGYLGDSESIINKGGVYSVIGDNNSVTAYKPHPGSRAVIIGNNNNISANDTYILGSNIYAYSYNSVILGDRSTDGGNNTVSVGSYGNERRIVFVKDGAISEFSKDAINGSQIYSILQDGHGINVNNWKSLLNIQPTTNTSDGDNQPSTTPTSEDIKETKMIAETAHSEAKMAKSEASIAKQWANEAKNEVAIAKTNIADLINNVSTMQESISSQGQQIQNLSQRITDNTNKINTVSKDASAGIASAVAIGSLPTSNEPGGVMFAMAGGSYDGQSAMALGLSKRTDNGKFSFKANVSANTRGKVAVGAGVGYLWR